MTLKQLLILIGVATGLLWFAWFWVLLSIDPFATNFIGFLLFYLTLYLSLGGSIALGGFSLRKARMKEHPNFHLVSISFRQSAIISTMLISLLLLQGLTLLVWWHILVLIALATFAEVLLLTKQRRSTPEISFTVSQVQTYIPADPLFTKKTIE